MGNGRNFKVVKQARAGILPALAWAFFWPLSLFEILSCNPNDNKQITVVSSTKIMGSLDSESLKKAGGSVRAFQVSASGTREPIDGFSIQDGRISVAIGSTNIFSRPLTSAPEEFAFMGYGIADTHPVFKARFGERAVGFLRLELIGENAFVSDKPDVGYAQLLVPISRRLLLSGDVPLELLGKEGGSLKLADGIGRLKVTVQSKLGGTPLEGALVTAISLTKSDVRNVPLLTPDDPNYGPIYQKTTAEGLADVFALRTAPGADPSVQLIATAPGFCHFVGEPEVFVLRDKISRSLPLEICAGAEDTKPGRLRLEFDDKINLATLEIGGEKQTRGLVNEDRIKVKLLTASPVIRPLHVLVYEGTKPEGKPRFDSTVPTFASTLQIEVPRVFNDGKSLNGAFVISVQSVFSDSDRAQFGAAPVALLYGIKSAAKPDLKSDDVIFRSSVGSEGIISGQKGSKFTLEYKKCEPEGEIATWLGGLAPAPGDLFFQICASGPVTSTADQVGVTDTLVGGSKTALVYYRDPFGNVNEILLNSSEGKKAVYVDYGSANLVSQPIAFGSDMGFALKGEPTGTATEGYIFKSGLKVTPGTVTQFVLRFANGTACRHGGASVEDGNGSANERGHLLSTFVAGSSADRVTAITAETKCGEDLSLASLDIGFPFDLLSTGEAEIFIRVRDLAGNSSNAFRQTIPRCSNPLPPPGTSTVHICWSS